MGPRACACGGRRLAAVAAGWLAFAGLLLDAPPGAAQGARADIAVEGNHRVGADAVRSYFHAKPGERLDAADLDAALKALYASGLFEDAHVRQAGGRVIVTVVEAPVIDKIAFEGNQHVKDDQLKNEIQSKPRGTFSRATVHADVERIVELYRRAGRYNVRVDPKVIARKDNRVDLVFEIRDGERTAVREIGFVGNRAFSARQLRDVIKTSESNILSFFKSTDVYDPDRVEADRDLLRRFYLKHGYADARVVSAVAEFDPGKKGFVITFAIDEGEPYRFGAVDIQSSVRDVDPASLRARLRTRAGDPYNAEAVEKTVEQLAVEVSKRGYAFAQVHPHADRNYQARLINLVYAIDEGQRAYIERINIRGNTHTRDYVIRREFDIAEGDAYNKVLIDRAERRLKNLNYFKSVKIEKESGSSPDRVVLNVDVEEQLTGDFTISGGYSTVVGPLAEVSVGERNLMGTGQAVKASVTYGEYAKGIDLSLVEPYFLGSRASAGVEVFGKQMLPNSYQSYGTDTYGATLSMGMPLTEELGTQWRYSLYNQQLVLAPSLMGCYPPANPPPGCTPVGEASLPIRQAAANGAAWISSVGNTVAYDSRDAKKNPKSGVYAEMRQDLAGVGGDEKFIRTTGDVRYYQEVAPDVVAMGRVQGGFITGWDGQQVPLMNSFFGGPQMVRGFAPNGFGPRDLTPGTTMDNVGGTKYFVTTAEAQAPIPYLPSDFGLKLAVFSDAGSVWGYGGPNYFPQFGQSVQVADSTFIRSSVGVGLVWDSPVGPLSIDYAIALTKTSYDQLQPLHFGVGGF
ncbi:MAG TPA: outer membrane protein assembly factor BamA [Xanthobacteraceae bacterium]|nr:outer membrane protein assembly factor BamA [Xanthobacteraceae bacterium]